MSKAKKPTAKSANKGHRKDENPDPPEKEREPFDKVEEAEEESFPASDPPAY